MSPVFSESGEVISLELKGFDHFEGDAETLRMMRYLVGHSVAVLKSLSEVHRVLIDMATVRQMISRYPWHGTPVTKLKHVELTWFLFQNLCYKFKEKLKLYHKYQKILATVHSQEPGGWLKAELKLLDKAMGEAIRGRGNSVHSWDEQVPTIEKFSFIHMAVEMRASGADLDLPEGFFDISGHYSDAKWMLKSDADRMIRDAFHVFERVVAMHGPTPVKLLQSTNEVISLVRSGAALKANKAFRA